MGTAVRLVFVKENGKLNGGTESVRSSLGLPLHIPSSIMRVEMQF